MSLFFQKEALWLINRFLQNCCLSKQKCYQSNTVYMKSSFSTSNSSTSYRLSTNIFTLEHPQIYVSKEYKREPEKKKKTSIYPISFICMSFMKTGSRRMRRLLSMETLNFKQIKKNKEALSVRSNLNFLVRRKCLHDENYYLKILSLIVRFALEQIITISFFGKQ